MTANVNEELFDGGPLLRWEKSLGLIKPGRPLVERRSLLAVLIGWLPLAVLAAVQLFGLEDESAKSFFSDFGVHARFLIAVPALIFAEAECIPRLGKIANHFATSGLVGGEDDARFQAAVSSTRRLLDSTVANAATLVLVGLVVVAVAVYSSTDAWPAWHSRGSTSAMRFSLAGWWHLLVSLPLLLILFFGWIWRLALWARFLFLMSRLNLRLIPAHPDNVGGLKFVSSSLRGFRLISLACGAVVAGAVANNQVHLGMDPREFRNLVIGLLVFLVVLFAGPLTIFFKQLREAKRRGTFEYGALARSVGAQFEEKWIRQTGSLGEGSLAVQDFSATTDLFSITEHVYGMREFPFTWKDLVGPIVVGALIPFLPVLLIAMPLKEIVQALAKLLL